MGIGASKGQGSEATYEIRDVETVSADKSNWPELAGAKLAESNGSGRKPHICIVISALKVDQSPHTP